MDLVTWKRHFWPVWERPELCMFLECSDMELDQLIAADKRFIPEEHPHYGTVWQSLRVERLHAEAQKYLSDFRGVVYVDPAIRRQKVDARLHNWTTVQDSLDPELENWMEHSMPDTYYVKHPLAFGSWHSDSDSNNRRLNLFLQSKKLRILDAIDAKDWCQMMWLYEKPYRVHVFERYAPIMTDRQYWRILGALWVNSENIRENRALWHRLLASERPRRECFMYAHSRKYLASLLDEVTIYRGYVEGQNKSGASWTLSQTAAEWFATRFSFHKRPLVAVATVSKNDIFAYMGGSPRTISRSEGNTEFEVIVKPSALKRILRKSTSYVVESQEELAG